MLVLTRKNDEWVDVTHSKTGDTFSVRVYDIRERGSRDAKLAFDDSKHNFRFERRERLPKRGAPIVKWRGFV